MYIYRNAVVVKRKWSSCTFSTMYMFRNGVVVQCTCLGMQ